MKVLYVHSWPSIRDGATVRHDPTTAPPRENRMPSTPDTTAPARMNRRGGASRALARSWREAVIPLGAGDATAVPILRALTRRILAGWKIPESVTEDVELCVSELATNALIHTAGPVRVRLALRGGTVRLDVADTSPHRACGAIPDIGAECGRGLLIVAVLADRVRTEPYPGCPAGKVTVAEFHLA